MPDPGLTDLIAPHWTWREVDEDGDHIICACGTTYHNPQRWAEHLKFVVEQHTNGQMARVDRLLTGWRDRANAQQARAETAEATIARVRGVEAEYLDPEDVDIECREDVWRFIRDLRAALEGERQ